MGSDDGRPATEDSGREPVRMDVEPGAPEHRISRAGLLRAAGAALLLGTEGTKGARAAPAYDSTITRCAIHPSIGIARVGNSPSGYYIGPEVPGVVPNQGKSYKDNQGRIKRQVARFRIYGLNAAGQVVKELTANDADITWSAHLANKKAAWYQFKLALDIPEVSYPTLPPTMHANRRNPKIKGARRRRLVIDPGPRSIKGKNTQGRSYHFDSGTFLGRQVPLGELRTDASGRLLLFGGHGAAGTTDPKHYPPRSIANNDGWYDDTSDGPVTATVVIRGRSLPVTSAWAIVAPPNYAPGITPVVTLYDITYQAYLDTHPKEVQPVSFMRDIYPIFERLDRMQWVNEGFFQAFGWLRDNPILEPIRLQDLANNAASTAPTRQSFFNRFRDPTYRTMQGDSWPPLYGDNFAQPPLSPRQYMALTREQYRRLREWAAGNFIADWTPKPVIPQTLEALPINARPAALDRAALESCSGGPFHPGEEGPWILRQPSMYAGRGRFRIRGSGDASEPDYGSVLTPPRALGPDGPLHRSGPGDVTRWMAVPWQTDTANCGSAYPHSTVQPSVLPDVPTFWPASVPNKVLTEGAYRRILNGGLDLGFREDLFTERSSWMRHLPMKYQARNTKIITDWYRLGIVIPRRGLLEPLFPPTMYVETESNYKEAPGPIIPPSERDVAVDRQQFSDPALEDRRAHL